MGDDNVVQLHPVPVLCSPGERGLEPSDLVLRAYPDGDTSQTLGIVLLRPPEGFDAWTLTAEEADELGLAVIRTAHTTRRLEEKAAHAAEVPPEELEALEQGEDVTCRVREALRKPPKPPKQRPPRG